MKYLKIKSEGLLDMRLVYLMGGTTKSNDEFKIGQFGTGLKYTLSFLIRNNLEFKIFIGGKEVVVSTLNETIRETNFEIICINGDKTSITTNMGLDWKAWMIVRELWCNALDEINPERSIVEYILPSDNSTEFYIQLAGDIKTTWDNWNKYFIHDIDPIMVADKFSIYPGGEQLRIYKHGVLIDQIKGKKSVFSYDIKNASLNELRQSQSNASMLISECLPDFDAKTAELFLTGLRDTYEDSMDYNWYSYRQFSSGWANAIGKAKFCDYKTYDRIAGKYPNIELEAIVKVPKGLFDKLQKYFPGISLLRASDKLNEFYETYSDKLNDKVSKCKSILEKSGYYIDPSLRIIFGVFGNKSVNAQVSMDDKEIRLCEDLSEKSDSKLISILIEENEHFKTGFNDETREFQQHFIDLYANLLLKSVKVLL